MDDACLAAAQDVYECVAGLECAELGEYLEGGPQCEQELNAAEEACEDQICEEGGYGGDGACGYEIACPDQPVYSVDCTIDGGCECSIDGEVVGACDDYELVCVADIPVDAAMMECCGFDL